MRYSIRDILGHFVKPRSAKGDLCPHACCRGYRPHPDKFPILLKPKMLRGMTEDELAEHMGRFGQHERAARQIAREFDRRDRAEAAKRHRKGAARQAALDRHEQVHGEMLRAEKATRGHMLNKAGLRAGVSEMSLYTGSESHALRYASPELLRYWEQHGRITPGKLAATSARANRTARARSDIGSGYTRARTGADRKTARRRAG